MSDKKYFEAKRLIKLLSSERTTNFPSWLDVCKCLHNIDNRLLDDWIEFNKKYAKNFSENDCKSSWNKIQPSFNGISNLQFFASKDSPDELQKMYKEKLNGFLKNNSTEITCHLVAELLMEKYQFRLKCASIHDNIWYVFKNHRWTKVSKLDKLVIELANKCQEINAVVNQYQGDDKEKQANVAKNLSTLIQKLDDNNFRQGVINQWAVLSYDPSFLKNLDENPHLICFENGVYDLDANVFRDGYPDDYISLCTGYCYTQYDKNDKCIKDIKNFLKKIQPNKEMRQYLKRLLSTCLAGYIAEDELNLCTSMGGSGVSTLLLLMKYALGDLCHSMNPNLLTNNKTSFYEILEKFSDKKGVRMIVFDGLFSNITNDTVLQMMVDNNITLDGHKSFRRQFKSFILCSHLSSVKIDSTTVRSKVKVIPFTSRFIEGSREIDGRKNEYWVDTSLFEKIPEWREMFMSLLINSYQKYSSQKLQYPDLVIESTDQFLKKIE